MKARRIGGFVAIVMAGMITWGIGLRAQQGAPPQKNPFAAADEKILAEVRDHNEIMANLEYLSDMIGQRLTGSENLKKANEWTKQRFTDYGVVDDRAYLDARNGDGADCDAGRASLDDCFLRLGGEYRWASARSGGLCEDRQGGGSRAVQRQVERGDRDHVGADSSADS
jgi:hypothetical protein